MEKKSDYLNWALLITVCIIFFAKLVIAQPQQQKPGQPAIPDSSRIVQMVNNLAGELKLTSAQKDKMLKLHFAHFKEVKAALKNFKGEREKHREMMDSKREEFEKKIKSFLSEKQIKQYENFLKQHPGPQNAGRKQDPSKH